MKTDKDCSLQAKLVLVKATAFKLTYSTLVATAGGSTSVSASTSDTVSTIGSGGIGSGTGGTVTG